MVQDKYNAQDDGQGESRGQTGSGELGSKGRQEDDLQADLGDSAGADTPAGAAQVRMRPSSCRARRTAQRRRAQRQQGACLR